MNRKQQVLTHYLSDTTESPVAPLKTDDNRENQSSALRFYAVGVSILSVVFGFIFTLIGAAKFKIDDDHFWTEMVRLFGWGMFLLFGGILIQIHVQLSSPKRKFSFVQKSMMLLLLPGLYIFLVNALLIGYLAEDVVCEPWYPLYNPDVGGCDCDERPLLRTETTPFFDTSSTLSSLKKPILIATIGDLELNDIGRQNLLLVKSKNPDFLVINGDLTYVANPKGLDALLTEVFGANFPVFITVGNHDTGIYTEYQAVFQERYVSYTAASLGLDPLEQIRCVGEIGVNQICSYKNMGFLFNGVGSTCMTDSFLNSNLEAQLNLLESSGIKWRTVFIHKNQKLLQTGGKTDEVGYFAFEQALEKGAMMINAHEHEYARTKQLFGVGKKPKDFVYISEAAQEFINKTEVINLGPGSFAVLANGLGSKSIREPEKKLEENPWWSIVVHANSDYVNYGASICQYNFDASQPNLAKCYFETVDKVVIDQYFLRTNN